MRVTVTRRLLISPHSLISRCVSLASEKCEKGAEKAAEKAAERGGGKNRLARDTSDKPIHQWFCDIKSTQTIWLLRCMWKCSWYVNNDKYESVILEECCRLHVFNITPITFISTLFTVCYQFILWNKLQIVCIHFYQLIQVSESLFRERCDARCC